MGSAAGHVRGGALTTRRLAALCIGLAGLAPAGPLLAQDQALPDTAGAIDAALLGCERWVLFPAIWAEDTTLGAFEDSLGPPTAVTRLAELDEAFLPPTDMRHANHYWRITATDGTMVNLVVSDRLPICHITASGAGEVEAATRGLTDTPGFTARWKAESDDSRPGMRSILYRNREDEGMVAVVSHTTQGGSEIGLRLIATAVYDFGE